MVEIRTVTTLRSKRDEIRRSIKLYEKRLNQARADLAHLWAAISIFESKSGDITLPAYADIQRLFRYGEAFKRLKKHGFKTESEASIANKLATHDRCFGRQACNWASVSAKGGI